jgi:hypothetical protein
MNIPPQEAASKFMDGLCNEDVYSYAPIGFNDVEPGAQALQRLGEALSLLMGPVRTTLSPAEK